MSLFAACLDYAVLPNAVFCCRPRMNISSKAWLPHPTPDPQWGVGEVLASTVWYRLALNVVHALQIVAQVLGII